MAHIKASERDEVLVRLLVDKLHTLDPSSARTLQVVQRLSKVEAIIATGSTQSADHFFRYFGKYPHIIRKTRNAVAVLSGRETPEELKALSDDICLYFGLGCRNVSKLYVPLRICL